GADDVDGVIGILTGKGPACDELSEWLEAEGLVSPGDVKRQPGSQIAWQRNQVVYEMYRLDRKWVLYIDNDEVPNRGDLGKLLATGLPLVSGVVLTRGHPFEVCAIKSFEPHEYWTDRELFALHPTDPFPVPACGTGFLLVRREVFDAMPRPWF